jgi:arginase
MPHIEIIINAPFGQGQKKNGVELGCDILFNCIIENMPICHHKTIAPTINVVEAENGWQYDYENLYNELKNFTSTYILVGGDHSIGMSSVASSIYKTPDVNNLYVIWIDAHADANTMEASITKSIHGQPLASIMGYEDPWFPIKCILPASNLLYFGIRDLDEFEKQTIKTHNIFNTCDLEVMLEKINEILMSNPNAVFHVSFDVDALDSSIMTSTGCVVDSGLSINDVISVINCVKEKMIAFDLVEFNPCLGDMDSSLDSVVKIIQGISIGCK